MVASRWHSNCVKNEGFNAAGGFGIRRGAGSPPVNPTCGASQAPYEVEVRTGLSMAGSGGRRQMPRRDMGPRLRTDSARGHRQALDLPFCTY